MGGDTGPLHLAHALGAPVLMVMGPTDPARHGPYGAPERALAHRLPCSFCYRRFAEPKACLLDIAPREVAARAAALMA
jgi:ADP-heptose:LPS heptosyltransferase